MSKQLSPKYNPAEVETGRYQKWLDADVFFPFRFSCRFGPADT